jgi:putative FmdB family regulatory protein
MPAYDFTCNVCGARFERQIPYLSMTVRATCPQGHTDVRRRFSVPAVVFKGSGFYVTDHRAGGQSASSAGTGRG